MCIIHRQSDTLFPFRTNVSDMNPLPCLRPFIVLSTCHIFRISLWKHVNRSSQYACLACFFNAIIHITVSYMPFVWYTVSGFANSFPVHKVSLRPWVIHGSRTIDICGISVLFTGIYSTNHVYLHRPNAFGFWQTRLHLCYETLKRVSNFSELA